MVVLELMVVVVAVPLLLQLPKIGDVDDVSVSYLISLLIHMAYTDKMPYWEYQGKWYQNALLRN